jgi:hypothetical protein
LFSLFLNLFPSLIHRPLSSPSIHLSVLLSHCPFFVFVGLTSVYCRKYGIIPRNSMYYPPSRKPEVGDCFTCPLLVVRGRWELSISAFGSAWYGNTMHYYFLSKSCLKCEMFLHIRTPRMKRATEGVSFHSPADHERCHFRPEIVTLVVYLSSSMEDSYSWVSQLFTKFPVFTGTNCLLLL